MWRIPTCQRLGSIAINPTIVAGKANISVTIITAQLDLDERLSLSEQTISTGGRLFRSIAGPKLDGHSALLALHLSVRYLTVHIAKR